MKLIYVCSPYRGATSEIVSNNVNQARNYCLLVIKDGGIPFAPHLLFTQFLDDRNSFYRHLGLFLGLKMLERCDELWVFGEPTSGMSTEIHHAIEKGVPIRWFDSEGRAVRDE